MLPELHSPLPQSEQGLGIMAPLIGKDKGSTIATREYDGIGADKGSGLERLWLKKLEG